MNTFACTTNRTIRSITSMLNMRMREASKDDPALSPLPFMIDTCIYTGNETVRPLEDIHRG